MKQRFWILASALALLTACRDPNDVPPGGAVISFASQRQDTVVREVIFNVSPGGRRIIMNGGYILPHPCFTPLDSTGDQNDNTIDVTITATPTGQTCPAVVAHYVYSMVLGNFVPGDYKVRIRHRDTSGTRTIFDQTVAIPF